MIFYPAIDLKEGKTVRLYQGRMDKATVFGDDPAADAVAFAEGGCEWIHIVNLNKAVGETAGKNAAALAEIIAAVPKTKLQLGGGIRSLRAVEDALKSGVSRVALGTMAVESPELVKEACRLFPGKIAVAVDCIDGRVAIRGWLKNTSATALELAAQCADAGAEALIYTDIKRDGAMSGPGTRAAELAAATGLAVIASGGVASLDDLIALKAAPLAGVIVGRALYEGKFTVARALAALD